MNESFMTLAISLAKKGDGKVNPNPLVGAVIVKDNHIIGQGWHETYGALHAERHALKNLTTDCKGAEMYVTLEPCCHYGKQPPCTQAIIESGIKTVYIGSSDPNPLVSGKGIQILREHKIKVIEHVMEKECDALNPVFFHYIKQKMPYVALKYAMTLDGKTATQTGLSKWITGENAREHVHTLRNHYTGIMAGIGTVLSDNPMLNCRMENGRNPIRIICDSRLRIPLDSQLVQTASQIPTIVATLEQHCTEQSAKLKALEQNQVTVLTTPEKDGHLHLPSLLKELAQRKIDGILLEGGGTLSSAMLQENLVQYIHAYIAPKIFGGTGMYTPVNGLGIAKPDDAWRFHFENMVRLGDDILLEGPVA